MKKIEKLELKSKGIHRCHHQNYIQVQYLIIPEEEEENVSLMKMKEYGNELLFSYQ
jgi:hypothetical protein